MKPEAKTYYYGDKLYVKFNKDVPTAQRWTYDIDGVQNNWGRVEYGEDEEIQRPFRNIYISRVAQCSQESSQTFKAGDIIEVINTDDGPMGTFFPQNYPWGINFE